jgi:hypothetical protein
MQWHGTRISCTRSNTFKIFWFRLDLRTTDSFSKFMFETKCVGPASMCVCMCVCAYVCVHVCVCICVCACVCVCGLFAQNIRERQDDKCLITSTAWELPFFDPFDESVTCRSYTRPDSPPLLDHTPLLRVFCSSFPHSFIGRPRAVWFL